MNSKVKFTDRQYAILQKYVLKNKQQIISHLYINIIAGFKRFPRRYGFFKDLGKKLKKNFDQGQGNVLSSGKKLADKMPEPSKEAH